MVDYTRREHIMTINLSVPQTMQELRPRITVVGVGGAGGNAVNNMINADLDGVDFLVANTDGQALAHSLASRKIQLGTATTQGLGAGSKPDVGRAAAEESIEGVMSELADCNLGFIPAGMGGGTGTGAAPVIAKAARERGILTVGVVTKPFDFEGQRRMAQAETGIEEMQSYVDTLIVIPNQNLFRLATERTTFADAFHIADTVLHQGVAGVTDLMIKPGQINLDFADIRAVMSEMGKAMMGTGEASGDNRATQAAEAAINNPLLDDVSMQGARALLINVTGGMDMTLFEVDEAANRIRREVDPEAVIIFGSTFDEKLDGVMRVSIVATGIDSSSMARVRPTNVPTMVTPPRPSTIINTPAMGAAAAASPAIGATGAITASQKKDDEIAITADKAEDGAPASQTASPAENDIADNAPDTSSTTSDDDGDEAYVPAFVPTKKTSRLAFLATGKSAPRAFAEGESKTFGEGINSDAEQMSLDEAIARERAAAFATNMPATPQSEASESGGDAPVMVADSADAISGPSRKPFIPAAPTSLPDDEAVPASTVAAGKTSLINKISGLWTGKPSEETTSARVEPAVERPSDLGADAEAASTASPALALDNIIAPASTPAPESTSVPAPAPAMAEADSEAAPSILDLPRAEAMSRMPEKASTTSLDRPADDLEIPAFLRRQAN
jgi:cell division protein FtsZ